MANPHTDHQRFERGIATRTFERTAGAVLALGALVLLLGGLLHPPSTSSVSVISESVTRWVASHWLMTGGTFLVGLGSLLVVFSQSTLASNRVTLTAWTGVALGSLPEVVFLVGESTVLPDLATGGGSAGFAAWRSFIEMGVIASLLPITIGLLLVAWTQARGDTRQTPGWVAWGAVLAFLVGVVWIVGFGFLEIEALEPVFIAILLGFIWLAWLGLSLARSPTEPTEPGASTAQSPD